MVARLATLRDPIGKRSNRRGYRRVDPIPAIASETGARSAGVPGCGRLEMTTPGYDATEDATQQFERDLGDLIAAAFGRGAAIERTWEVTMPATDAPNWRVTIEKTYSEEAPAYEPQFLDE